MSRKSLILFLALVLILAVATAYSTTVPIATKTPMPNIQTKSWDKPPEVQIDTNKKYQALIKTSEGNMIFDLDALNSPITVNNFVFLTQNKFYDNTIFHRVVKNFMIQGGDPEGSGAGGPGYTFDDEKITKDYKRGAIAMANRGPNTNGSQFFIMHTDYPLPKNYVIFGQLVSGFEVLDKIANGEVTTAPSGELSKPVSPVAVQTIEINEQ